MPKRHSRPGMTWFLTGLSVAVAAVLFRPAGQLVLDFACRGTRQEIGLAEVSRSVAGSLTRWGLFGAVPDREPEYTTLEHSVGSRILGVRGLTSSDGFHGDGTDWYEVVLSPYLASELRVTLRELGAVKKEETTVLPRAGLPPPWWPTQWPPDARVYTSVSEYLVLPETGTRAWFMRVRT